MGAPAGRAARGDLGPPGAPARHRRRHRPGAVQGAEGALRDLLGHGRRRPRGAGAGRTRRRPPGRDHARATQARSPPRPPGPRASMRPTPRRRWPPRRRPPRRRRRLAAPTAADWPPEREPSAPAAIRPRWPVIAGVVALMAVVAVVGYVVGQSGSDDASPASKVATKRRPRRVLQRELDAGRRARRGPRPRARLPDRPAVGERPHRRGQDRPSGPGPAARRRRRPAARRRTSCRSNRTAGPAPHRRPHRRGRIGPRRSSCRRKDGPQAIACAGATAEGLRGRGGDPRLKTGAGARHPARREDYATALTRGAAGRPRPPARAPTGARPRALGELHGPRRPPPPRQPAHRPGSSPRAPAIWPAPKAAAEAKERPSPPRSPAQTARPANKRLAAASRAHDAAAYRRAGAALRPRRGAPRGRHRRAAPPRIPGGGRCVRLRIPPARPRPPSRSLRWPFPPSRWPSRRPTTTT